MLDFTKKANNKITEKNILQGYFSFVITRCPQATHLVTLCSRSTRRLSRSRSLPSSPAIFFTRCADIMSLMKHLTFLNCYWSLSQFTSLLLVEIITTLGTEKYYKYRGKWWKMIPMKIVRHNLSLFSLFCKGDDKYFLFPFY